jgi:hypothetical protein
MLPKEGDAPGHDPREIGRPATVRRFAQLREHGAPQTMTVYVAEDGGPNEDALEAFYRRDLEERGWRLFGAGPREGTGLLSVEGGRVSAEKNDRMVTLLFQTNDDGHAAVTILEAR